MVWQVIATAAGFAGTAAKMASDTNAANKMRALVRATEETQTLTKGLIQRNDVLAKRVDDLTQGPADFGSFLKRNKYQVGLAGAGLAVGGTGVALGVANFRKGAAARPDAEAARPDDPLGAGKGGGGGLEGPSDPSDAGRGLRGRWDGMSEEQRGQVKMWAVAGGGGLLLLLLLPLLARRRR